MRVNNARRAPVGLYGTMRAMVSGNDIFPSPAAPGKIRLVAVYGPTACGKTALAVELARTLGGECVNADSRQAYRGLDVGTGKATAAEMKGIPHHLLNFVSPDEDVTVGTFAPLARAKIAEISARGKLPILVGGTGLYLDAILRGFDVPSAPPDEAVREKWEAFASTNGPRALWEELRKRDPAYAAKTEPNNVRFVVRALEVLETTGKKKSDAGAAQESPYDMVLVTPYAEETVPSSRAAAGGVTIHGIQQSHGLLRSARNDERNPTRAALYDRIDARTAGMFTAGILEEAKIVLEKFGPDAPGLRAIGYAEAAAVLAGTMKLPDAAAQAQQRARNYAKRQLTWFRRWPERYPGKCREGLAW